MELVSVMISYYLKNLDVKFWKEKMNNYMIIHTVP